MRLWQLQIVTAALLALGILAAGTMPRVVVSPTVRAMCAQPGDAIERSACAGIGL